MHVFCFETSKLWCRLFQFFAGEVPKMLPFALNSLKRLHLSEFSLDELDVASCAFYLIKSFPFLQEIEIEVLLSSFSYVIVFLPHNLLILQFS